MPAHLLLLPLRRALPLLALLALPLAARADPAQDAFWRALLHLCGQAFEGRVIDPQPQDAAFASAPLVVHVRQCSATQVRMPLHVGTDRSRTWVLTRTPQGLRLKHEHRHADGHEERVTQYGGDASGGTALAQHFPTDAHTRALLPASASNVWSIEVTANTLSYRLQRPGTPPRRFEARFDLSRPVALPAPPWGASE